MNAFLNHWMPVLRRCRAWLMLSLLLCMGAGWSLSRPTAPITTWSLDDDVLLGLTMLAPHTLVVAMQQHTWLYPTLDAAQATALPGQGPLDIQGGYWGHQSMSSSLDGHWLAIATVSHLTPPNLHDDVINVWSVPDQRLLAQLPVPLSSTAQSFYMLNMSPDAQRIGWITRGSGYESHLTIWDRLTQTAILTKTHQGAVKNSDFTLDFMSVKDSEAIGVYYGSAGIEVRQLRDGRRLYQLPVSDYPFTLSPDGTLLALREDQAFVAVRRIHDGKLVQRLPYHTSVLLAGDCKPSISFSADSRSALVATAFIYSSGDGLWVGAPRFKQDVTIPAQLWDLPTGQVVQSFATQVNGAKWVALSPDGQYAVTADEHTLRVFRVQPQLPFLQPLCVLASLALAVLLFWQWLWARNYHASMKDEG